MDSKKKETKESTKESTKEPTEGTSWKYRKRNQMIIKDNDPWWQQMENDDLKATYISKQN